METKFVGEVPAPSPQAHINTSDQGAPDNQSHTSLDTLTMFASAGGDISDLLTETQLTEIGVKAVREWEIDEGSRAEWKRKAQRNLDIAAQEREDDDEREPIWDNAANIHAPMLTLGALGFAAKAGPDLIRGDQVVGMKVFNPPKPPTVTPPPPPPQNAQEAQQLQAQAQQAAAQKQQDEVQQTQQEEVKNARADRVKRYMNYLIFYKMDGWEDETDQLLHEAPVVGGGLKKVYMSSTGLCSDYVSALRLCVHKDTKSLYRCPRITEDFEVYPYEIEERIRSGRYRDGDLPPPSGEDTQKPRHFIEQHRVEDLDEDGVLEPYIATVDVETKTVMRIEPAFTADDVMTRDGRVTRIDRWLNYAPFRFMPDMRGGWYGMGFGQLLEPIQDSVDATINQLLDAGTAEIAGGGFISGGVRLQGAGQGGVVTFQPGEYAVANVAAGTLQESVWERTVPHPSAVSLELMQMLMDWGKEIMSTQAVATGDGPAQAPVGTTFALQNQALMSYRACFKRMFRGFREEFRLMYLTLKRYKTDKERKEYTELTGGDMDEDFGGDGTDIQPVADPSVVTKMQKMARDQALTQIAESELGQAAGMTQPKQAQAIVRGMLIDMDYDEPDKYIGDVQPNPEVLAKAQDLAASAQLKGAQAQERDANVGLTQARTVREMGLAAIDTHELHKEADRIAQTGSVADAEALMDPAEEAEKDRKAKPKPAGEAK